MSKPFQIFKPKKGQNDFREILGKLGGRIYDCHKQLVVFSNWNIDLTNAIQGQELSKRRFSVAEGIYSIGVILLRLSCNKTCHRVSFQNYL